MKPTTASLLFAGLLAVSLGIKVAAFASQTGPAEPTGHPIRAYLSAHDFAVTAPDPEAAPAWVTGTRGACRLRIADVAPEGWTRNLVDQQKDDGRTLYAFDGSFYDAQPVWRTRIEKYRRRLIRYFGLHPPELAVRAINVSPGCPAGIPAPADAAALSN